MARADKKNRSPFVDVLENLFLRLYEHQEHFLYYSLVDLDWSEIRCGHCKRVVLDGSRDLVELLWIEVNLDQTQSLPPIATKPATRRGE